MVGLISLWGRRLKVKGRRGDSGPVDAIVVVERRRPYPRRGAYLIRNKKEEEILEHLKKMLKEDKHIKVIAQFL